MKSALLLFFLLYASAYAKKPATKIGLMEAISLGLNQNSAILNQKVELRKGRLQALQHRAKFMPSVNLQANRTLNLPNYQAKEIRTEASLDISHRLDLTGKDYDLQKSLELKPQVSALELKELKSKYVEGLLHGYLELFLAKSHLKSARSQKTRVATLHQAVKAKVKRGRLSESDFLEATYQLESAQSDILEAELGLRTAKRSLISEIFSRKPSAEIEFARTSEIIDLLSKKLVPHFKNVKQRPLHYPWVEKDNLQEESFLKSVAGKRAFLPDFYASYKLSRDIDGDTGSLPNSTSQAFTLAASWNLFDGFSDAYQQRLDHAQLEILRLSSRTARNQFYWAVESLLDQVDTHSKLLKTKTSLLSLAEAKFETSKAIFDAGRLSTKDLIDQQAQILQASSSSTQAKVTYYKSVVSFLHTNHDLLSFFRGEAFNER